MNNEAVAPQNGVSLYRVNRYRDPQTRELVHDERSFFLALFLAAHSPTKPPLQPVVMNTSGTRMLSSLKQTHEKNN